MATLAAMINLLPSTRIGAGVLALVGLYLVSAAAKDLPRGGAPPRAVTSCDAFGPEFHKIEGSDTCVRIGGSVTLESRWSTTSGGGFFANAPRR